MKIISFSRFFTTIFIVFLASNISKAQAPELPKIAPLSPEVSSLAKFSEVPVSYYTGVPNVSIPITTLNGRSISIPVSVSYHAGGHKVSDIASWVGLGWNLNVGGQVYRSMNQLPDDFNDGKGFLTTSTTLDVFEGLSNESKNSIIHQATTVNMVDLAPDEFNFSFLGYSGKFMFNQNRTTAHPYGEIIFFPESDIKVDPVFDSNKRIIEWIITTNDGNTFYFGENNAIDQITDTKSYSTDNLSLPVVGMAPYTFSYTTAWKLTKIVTDKNDVINFYYSTNNYTQCTPTGESNIMSWSGAYSKSSSQTTGSNSVISEIVSANGKVLFNREVSARQDLSYDYALDNIIVKDNFNKQIQKIDFEYGYFQSTVPSQSFYLCSGLESNTEISKRLRLDKLKFYGDVSSSNHYDYELEYNTATLLPHRLSSSQDYWGYYNGASNTTLVPSLFYRETGQPTYQPDFFYQGANRIVNPSFTQANMLKKIIYPEGGKTEFEYENNLAAGSFDYPNSLNIFEPNTENSVYINTRNDATSSSQKIISKPFTINSPVEFQGRARSNSSSTIYDNDPNNNGGDYGANLPLSNEDIRFYIKEAATGTIVGNSYGVPIGYDPVFMLNPGNYILEIVISANTNVNPQAHDIIVDLKWNTRNNAYKLIGGLRIKSIKDYEDPNSSTPSVVRTYDYKNPITGEESGWILGVPIFKEAVFVQDEGQNDIPKTKASSNNLYALITTQSNYVGYTSVVESRVNNDEHLKNSFSFSFAPLYSSFFGAPNSYEWENGNLNTSISYIKKPDGSGPHPDPIPFMYNYIPLKKTETYYNYILAAYNRQQVRGLDIYQKAYDYGSLGQIKSIYDIFNGLMLQRESNSEELIYDDSYVYQYSINNLVDFTYGDPFKHLNPIVKESSSSNGDTLREEYKYPEDIVSPNAEIQALITQNKTSSPVSVKSFSVGNSNVSELNTVYKNWTFNDLILPKIVQTSKGVSSLEDRIVYHKYDLYGHPLEVSKADGMHIVYIWGYNQSQPIAMIENLDYASIPTQTIANLQSLSDSDNDRTLGASGNEGALRTALNALRVSYPEAMVSTYTYDPLVGVTSMTDAKGYTMYYEYDEFNRLKQVKDADGKILNETMYHYKQ
ncbi:hypothetical protein GCM10011531_28160 [Aquaticitalea lipolytica]|uniref:YD repeat-containing protein n=1 Tax=Aquaticitalea lipolytica TaxID=1247562 RepID=A0A8J2TV05_9FLAO|nr:RHS repeat domain-containing protein [Aquaticitalea lipolytica]GFZ94818.1 hypothetical protein GCM10011531_28160 [Aquaticitalea lipolytica]